MRLLKIIASTTAAWALFSGAASAKVITLSYSYDLDANRNAMWHDIHGAIRFNYSLPAPIFVQNGDSISVNVDFENGRRLHVTNPKYLHGAAIGYRFGYAQSQGGFVFSNPIGPIPLATATKIDTMCCSGFRNTFDSSLFYNGSGEFSLSGINWNASPTFNSVGGININSIEISLIAEGRRRFAISGAPEPGTWSLLILGFGGIGALLRYKRTRSVKPHCAHG